MFLKISQISQENYCARVSFCKETQARVFSCEIYEFFKNTVLTDHLWVTASVTSQKTSIIDIWQGPNDASVLVKIASPLVPGVH